MDRDKGEAANIARSAKSNAPNRLCYGVRMPTPLFMDGDAPDPGFRNIRDAKDGVLFSARCLCDYMWILFGHHADTNFRDELRSQFDARFWEMYLTVQFICAGYTVTCPKPGPDVGIVHRGKRIWFEAVSPTGGDPSKPDHVPPVERGHGKVSSVPNDKMVLRYLNSISEKYERQYQSWLRKGIVSKDDVFVIALNPCSIPHDNADSSPPRILQAAYTLGVPYLTLSRETGKAVGSGYQFRGHIDKTPKDNPDGTKEERKIQTGVFQDRKHDGLSALLCSRVDAVNHRGEYGSDFQLAPNPHASVPLPDDFRLRGTYYGVTSIKDGYQVTPTRRD